MKSYYTDDDNSVQCIATFYGTSGKKRTEYLLELCKFKTKSADEFWQEKISDETYLPYIMLCRSELFSDYAAKRLSDFIDRAIEGMNYIDAVNEAYFLLNVCAYSESDKLIMAYSKIGMHYDKLSKLKLSWGESGLISPRSQPEFLYKRYVTEAEAGSENTFFNMLNDVIILTMCNAIKTDGKSETFTAKIKQLYEEYPDAYTSVGFFAYFINDTGEAYDKFEKYTNDPLDYPKLMWVLDGLEFDRELKEYTQGSATAYAGEDNHKVHFSMPISRPDIRWFKFLTDKIMADTEKFVTQDRYFKSIYLNDFSVRIYNLIDINDEETKQIILPHLKKSAIIGGNAADFAGLAAYGAVATVNELEKLCLDIAEQICQGRQRYCYSMLFNYIKGFDQYEKLEVIEKLTKYIKENESSADLAEQRERFFEETERFKLGEQSIF